MGFGFTGLGTAEGAGKGTAALIVERLAAQKQAEIERAARVEENQRAQDLQQQGDYRRDALAATTAASESLRQVRLDQLKRTADADKYAAELEKDPTLDARAKTFLRLRRAVPDGSVPADLFKDGTTGSNTPEENFIVAFAKAKNKTPDQLTDAERLEARKKWGTTDDRPPAPAISLVWTPQGLTTLDRRNPGAGVQPVKDASAGGGQAQPGLSPSQRTQVASTEQGLDSLTEIERLFKPEYVGPATGRIRAIGQKIPGVPVNEEFSQFQAEVAAMRNATIKAITGAQMSEPEAKRIREQIPEITDKPEVFKAKLAATRRNQADLAAHLKATAPPPAGSGNSNDLLDRLNKRRQAAAPAP